MSRTVDLTKHHGLGNDFLVYVTDAMSRPDGTELARAVCDRHRGVGADGLLLALPAPADGSADVTMRLHNADGSLAGMSGNGIRCFVQACARAGLVGNGLVRVATDSGLRTVDLTPDDASGLAHVRVDMGVAKVGTIDVPDSVSGRAAQIVTVDVGNPHVVLLGGRAEIDAFRSIAAFGADIESHFAGGINVEVIRSRDAESIDMVVWERGVGVTQACGTGACASAIAWQRNGGPDRVVVHQPGGDAVVELSGRGDAVAVTLVGPTQFICRAEFVWTSS